MEQKQELKEKQAKDRAKNLEKKERTIYELLQKEEKSINEIHEKTGFSFPELYTKLFAMEIKELIISKNGKYQIK